MDAFRHLDTPVAARLARVCRSVEPGHRWRAGRIDAAPAVFEA